MGIRRVHRNATHRDPVGLALIPSCQCDIEKRCDEFGVVKKHLVEIAHPIEDDRVGIFFLHAQKLPHHRRV